MRKSLPVQFDIRAFGNGPSSDSDFLITILPLSDSVTSSQQSPVRRRVSDTQALASSLQAPFIGFISPFLMFTAFAYLLFFQDLITLSRTCSLPYRRHKRKAIGMRDSI